MKLATLPDGGPDGRLFVVSRDHRMAAPATGIALAPLPRAWQRLDASASHSHGAAPQLPR